MTVWWHAEGGDTAGQSTSRRAGPNRLRIHPTKCREAGGKFPLLISARLAVSKTQDTPTAGSSELIGESETKAPFGALAHEVPAPTPETRLGTLERHFLLGLARLTVADAVAGLPVPTLGAAEVPGRCAERGACFVTLTRGGELRGCVGQLTWEQPLYESVIYSAQAAAQRDARFAPLQAGEVANVKVEISVLGEPRRLRFGSAEELLEQLRPGRDGVILTVGSQVATFLPQVWDRIPDKREFLDRLAQKAGLAAGAWRGPGASVSVYEAECFEEEPPVKGPEPPAQP